MRICNGLSGETFVVGDQELPWKKLHDVVGRHAYERWGIDAGDLIVLEGSGGAVGLLASHHEEADAAQVGGRSTAPGDVFVFLRSALVADATSDQLGLADVREEPPGAAAPEASATAHPEDELLRLRAECGDPAVEAFRSNIAEARRYLQETHPVVARATREEERLAVQRLAAEAVLDNLATQRATCGRSLTLFLQKYERVQERLDACLGEVETSMAALCSTPLHTATRAPGRETLADVLPRDRILRFTANMQAERESLGQRWEKLKQRHAHAQALCEQIISGKSRQAPQEEAVTIVARKIAQEHGRAEAELMPKLCACVPREGAASNVVLEDEKRSDGTLEGIKCVCNRIWALQAEFQAAREKHCQGFLQWLREVSYVQSKIRDVEKQAVLLEEEINSQRNHTRQLTHLRRMPKAYQKMLYEIARRRHFRTRYAAQSDQARGVLSRMMEDENCRRRDFVQRYGCHLPADLLQGLGSLVPPVSIEVPEFDTSLPEIDFPVCSQGEAVPGGVSSASSTAGVTATAGLVGPGSARQRAHSGVGSVGSSGSGQQQLSSRSNPELRVAELEEKNRALEARVTLLLQEINAQRSSCAQPSLPDAVVAAATDTRAEEIDARRSSRAPHALPDTVVAAETDTGAEDAMALYSVGAT